MADLNGIATATLAARWHALSAALKVPPQNLTGAGVNDEQVDVIDGVMLDAQCETHEILACRPVRSSEEAHALIGVAFEILKDGPRNDEAGERILLSVADYLKGGGTLWDGWAQR